MPSLLEAAQSQVGRKILTGVTGVLLSLFVLVHLLGNLSLFGSANAFNIYSHTLESMGVLLYIVELGLLLTFLIHIYIGIAIALRKRKARPTGYKKYQTKGEPSRQSISSRTMIYTGLILLVFIVLHVLTFKYGDAKMVTVEGTQMRDLKSLVIDTFLNPLYTFWYIACMLLLGFHLRHGVWSAFTSLTMKYKRYSMVIYTLGTIFAILIAFGFLFIPAYIYFTGGHGSLIAYAS